MSKMGSVTVIFPGRRKVYVNGNYSPEFPKTIECTVLVEYGENVFETVTGDDRIDYRGTVVTNDRNKKSRIELTAVSPPEKKGR
jgi:hypothetical protein